MNLRRQFIKHSIEYYVKSGCSESEAKRHAAADAKWWYDELTKLIRSN